MADIRLYEQKIGDRPAGQVYYRADGVSAEAFGAGIGRGLAVLGQGISDVGDALRISKELTEEAQGVDRFQASRREVLERLYDPDDGFLTRTGRTSVGTTDQASETFDGVRERGREGLTPRAQRAYDAKLADFIDQSYVKVAEHETRQRTAYTDEMYKALIENALDDAGLNWADDEWFDQALQTGIAEVQKYGIFSGRDQAATNIAVENFVSAAVRNRVLAAAAADPTKVEGLIEQHRDLLTAKDLHELTANTRGLVADAKAQAFVGGFLRRGFDPSVDDPYERAVIRVESSGNPDARTSAEGGTASGLYGFTDGTYLATVRDLRQRGGVAWASGMTDAEVLATKSDAARSKEVFDGFRATNQAILRRQGLPVTPESEYIMHHFGAGDGPRILRTATTDPAQTLEAAVGATQAARILKFNPHLRKHATVGGMVGAISRNLGTDGATLAGGTHFDASAAYEAAMNITDPEVQAAALKRIETMEAAQSRARSAEQETTMRNVWDNYVRTGDTSLSVDTRTILGGAGVAAMQQAMANDIRGIDMTEPTTWEHLMRTMTEDPQTFADYNLEDHRPKLSRADMEMFVKAQSELRAKTAGADPVRDLPLAQLMAPGGEVYKRFTASLVTSGGDGKADSDGRKAEAEMARKRYEFDQRLRDMIEESVRQNGGRQPSQSEVEDMARGLLTRVDFTVPAESGSMLGRLFSSDSVRKGYLFEAATRGDRERVRLAVPVEDVPVAERRAIEAMWADEFGEVPTPEQIASSYANMNLLAQNLPTVVMLFELCWFLV